MLKIKKLFLLFFFSFLSLFSHTIGQKSAYLIGETDSTAQFTLWSLWTATSQTPWIRSYTPSLATFSTYHQSTTIIYTTHSLHNPYNKYIQQHTHTATQYPQSHDSCRHHVVSCSVMQVHAANLVDFPRSQLI